MSGSDSRVFMSRCSCTFGGNVVKKKSANVMFGFVRELSFFGWRSCEKHFECMPIALLCYVY